MSCNCVNRRDFLLTAAKASVSISILSLPSFGKSSNSSNTEGRTEVIIDLSQNENQALTKVGGAQYIAAPGITDQIIVIRKSETSVSAFTSKCSHRGGKVGLPLNGLCTCELHGAQFDLDGTVKKGPAVENQKSYSSRISDNKIYITTSSNVSITNSNAVSAGVLQITTNAHQKCIVIHSRHAALVEVYKLSGKLIHKQSFSSRGPHTIGTQELSHGRYIVKIFSEGRSFATEVVL